MPNAELPHPRYTIIAVLVSCLLEWSLVLVPAQAQSEPHVRTLANGNPAASGKKSAEPATTHGTDTKSKGRLGSGVTYNCERDNPPACGKGCLHDTSNGICVRVTE